VTARPDQADVFLSFLDDLQAALDTARAKYASTEMSQTGVACAPADVPEDAVPASAARRRIRCRHGLIHRDEVLLALTESEVGEKPRTLAQVILAPGEATTSQHYSRTYSAIKSLELYAMIEKKSSLWRLTARGGAEACAIRAVLAERKRSDVRTSDEDACTDNGVGR
jgi:hypothetical protein